MENVIQVVDEMVTKDSQENRYIIRVSGSAGIWLVGSTILIPDLDAERREDRIQYKIETCAYIYDRWGYVEDRAVKYSLRDAMNYVYNYTEEQLTELYDKDCEREAR